MLEVVKACELLHQLARQREVFGFPFDKTKIPHDGVYLLFEVGEVAHGHSRIVRVGTHTGDRQLRSRLQQHFLKESKDRSIFRKNIGRCILGARADPYAPFWELDLTSRAARESAPPGIDAARQAEVEKEVSEVIRRTFSFVVILVPERADRLRIESGIASLLFACPECAPSSNWLGRYSPKALIRESGLWQVNELTKEPLGFRDIEELLG